MSFNQMVINFSAPTFCRIKPGNLFFVRNNLFLKKNFDEWKKSFSEHGIMSFSLELSESSTAILVIDIFSVKKILNDIHVRNYLGKKGYEYSDEFGFINELFMRIKYNEVFPHEVGIILGYPLNDVIEFEKQHGTNFKYGGYWKSYSDVENAKKCQCKYNDCSCLCKNLYDNGLSLSQIINEYNKYAYNLR